MKQLFKKRATIVIFVVVVAAIVSLTLFGCREKAVKKLEDEIAIPCYGTLSMKADVCEQGFALSNPIENTCWFQITIALEDGTVIWKSGLIEPGSQSNEVVLFNPLDAGKYENVTIHYSCYMVMEEITPLNSGEERLTIVVK